MGFEAVNLVCCCLVIFGNLLHATTSSNNPGIKLRLSEKGLNYAAGVAVDVLVEKVRETTIPDQNGNVKTPVGKVEYGLSETKIKSFSCSSTSVSVNPGAGLTLMFRNLEIAIQGNWRYKYKRGFLRISDHGTYEGSVAQSAIDVSVTLGADALPGGRPTIRSIGCDCRLDAIEIQLSGGASWLYNVFVEQLEGTIRRLLQDATCQRIRRLVDEDAGSYLSSLQVVVPVADDEWFLDLGLVEPPRFQPGSVEFPLKGQFVHKDDVAVGSPFTADTFQLIDSDQMVTVGISEYALKTVGDAFFRRGIFHQILTPDDLSASERNFLSTNGTGACFACLVPAVKLLYPNATVELEMTATSPPDTLISVKGVRSKVSFLTTFRARMSNRSLFYLLTANVSATVGLTVTLGDSDLTGNLTGFVPSIAVTDSAVGRVEDIVLQTVFKLAARLFIVPRLNELLQKGVSLPVFKKFKVVNNRLETQSQFLQIYTDVLYKAKAE